MILDLSKTTDVKKARYTLEKLISGGKNCELKEIKKKRSLSQNNALYLLFTNIANQLNELGETFNYTGFKGEEMEMPFTMELIKTTLWHPIQKALYNIDSTTELTTEMINNILDVITKFFGNKCIPIVFPSQFELFLKQENERRNI